MTWTKDAERTCWDRIWNQLAKHEISPKDLAKLLVAIENWGDALCRLRQEEGKIDAT